MAKKTVIVALLSVLLLLVIDRFTVISAECEVHRAESLLRDPENGVSRVGLSEATASDYKRAVLGLEKALSLESSDTGYVQRAAAIYAAIESWSAAMEGVDPGIAQMRFSKERPLARATELLEHAIRIEPMNPDLHIALGECYDAAGRASLSDGEYRRAFFSAPFNAGVRYSVALRYLLTGRNQQAIEQSIALALIDDTYVATSERLRRELRSEERSSQYQAFLARSYLFRAMEIVWRASGRDEGLVRQMAPRGKEAQDVLRLFLEAKGIEA